MPSRSLYKGLGNILKGAFTRGSGITLEQSLLEARKYLEPSLKNWIIESRASSLKNWIVESRASSLKNWIVESSTSSLENWIVESRAQVRELDCRIQGPFQTPGL